MASFFRASARSRSSFLRSSSSARDPRRHFLQRRLQLAPPHSAQAEPACWRPCAPSAPVSASIRRTPAATPESDTPGNEPDVAGAAHMRAAAEFDRPAQRVAGPLTHRHDAHLVAVFLAEQRARAGGPRIVQRHQPGGDGRILQHDSRWPCPRRARSPRRVIGLGCEKSKRSRSGATSEPFCAT